MVLQISIFHDFLPCHSNNLASFTSGTEFKAAGCSVTGCLMALEIQHGKTEMAKQPHYGLGATAACTIHL